MHLSKKIIALASLAAFAPAIAFAQINTSYLQGSGQNILGLINGTIIPLLIAVVVIGFIWSAVRYFFGKSSKEGGDKHEQHRTTMIWGIVAIFVIVSVWGFVNILQNIFGVQSTSSITLPKVPTN